MLDRLEASGHIQRSFDPKDRRKVNIRLTDTAKNLKSHYNEVSMCMNKIFYEGFTDDEIIQFENALMRILNNLTREGK